MIRLTHIAQSTLLVLLLSLSGTARADSRIDPARESGIWPVKSGDSLYRIAQKLFPDDKAKRFELSEQLHLLNPKAFRNNDPNRLRVNVELTLPDFAVNKRDLDTDTQIAASEPEVLEPEPPKVEQDPQQIESDSNIDDTQVETRDPPQRNLAGKVLFARDGMTARQLSGAVRALERDSAVYQGDTITTPRRGFGQLQLTDGALLAIRPSTELVIEEFRYNGVEDGNESSVLRLIRGGFRTITGAIGQINKRQYRVNTLVATVGIRGTHYGLRLCEPACTLADGSKSEGLFGGVADGKIAVSNNSGDVDFGKSQYFRVDSIDTLPVKLASAPNLIFDGDQASRGGGSGDDELAPDPLLSTISDPEGQIVPADKLLDDLRRAEPNLGVEPSSGSSTPPPGEPPPIEPPPSILQQIYRRPMKNKI